MFNNDIVYFCEGFNESATEVYDSILLENKIVYTDPATRRINNMNQQETSSINAPKKIKKKKGRLSNGSGFILNDDIGCEYVIYTKRISYILINRLIIIGCYLPYLGGISAEIRQSNNHEFTKTLSDLDVLIDSLLDGTVEIIIVGDFNTDFIKMRERADELTDLLAKHSLTSADINHVQHVDYTYFKFVENRFQSSWLDHAFLNDLMAKLNECSINTSINNMGDHNAITLNYRLDLVETCKPVIKKRKKKKKTYWNHSIMLEEYKERSEKELMKLNDLKKEIIDAETNIEEILTVGVNEFGAALKRAEIRSSNVVKNNIKKEKKKKKEKRQNMYGFKSNGKSWWDETCTMLFQKMIDAFKQFASNGNLEEDYEKFKQFRRDFNNQKKFNKKLRRNKQLKNLNDLFKLDREAFWRRIKSMSKKSKKVTAKIEKLEEWFKKQFTERHEINKLEEETNQKLVDEFIKSHESTIFDIVIDKNDIVDALKAMKNGKSVGTHGISYENLKYAANDEVVDMIHVLFTKMINHKVLPKDFNVSIIKPLLKDVTKPANDLGNTRPVAISNALPNLFETILLNHLNRDHVDSPNQFGFKPDSSCNHAGYVLKEAINVAKNKNKKLYVVAIDASKAFDKVCRLALWAKLIKLNINPAIIYSLIIYYNASYMFVLNDDEISSLFKTSVGVRQGGVISPKLFNIYIEDIVTKVNAMADDGVDFGGLLVKIILYADDILLLSHTKRGLRRLSKAVEEFGVINEIKFNSNKTYYMLFNKNAKVSSIVKTSEKIQPDPVLNGEKITRTSELRYLGLELNDLNKNSSHLKKRKSLAYACLSRLISSGIYCRFTTDPKLIVQLYRTYVRPILFYGNENFDFNKTERAKLITIDGNIMKNMLGIPIQCHISDLQIAFGMDTGDQYLNKCKAKFIKRLIENEMTNNVLKYTIENRVPNSLSMHFFERMEVNVNERTYNRLIEMSYDEIDKYKELKNERKNLNIEINRNVTSIRKLINDYETINFQQELFKLIKFEDGNE